MKQTISYTRQWLSDWYRIFTRELKHIFSDSGVLVIFFLAGLAYPVLYGLIYGNSCVDDMPVAMVDCCGSSGSREFTRKLDATRELHIAYSCADLPEARRLMQQRKVKRCGADSVGLRSETGCRGTGRPCPHTRT